MEEGEGEIVPQKRHFTQVKFKSGLPSIPGK
jgi:hypothetical protein